MTQLITALKKEANAYQPLLDTLLVWSKRQRPRYTLTVRSHYFNMVKEGFKHTRADYAEAFRRLAAVGVGEAQKDKRGVVKALTGIKVHVPLMAQAVLGVEGGEMKPFKPKNRFQKGFVSLDPAPTRPIKDSVAGPVRYLVPFKGRMVSITLNEVEDASGGIMELLRSLQKDPSI